MNGRTTAAELLGAALVVQILATGHAAAYIDPGSGSFFVQMVLAAILGAGMAIKAYWHRIKSLFGGKSAPTADDEPRE